MSKEKRPHTFWFPKFKGTVTSYYGICTHCGLVKLKNEATQRAIRVGCDGATHEDRPS